MNLRQLQVQLGVLRIDSKHQICHLEIKQFGRIGFCQNFLRLFLDRRIKSGLIFSIKNLCSD
jgi:hypothetical protein